MCVLQAPSSSVGSASASSAVPGASASIKQVCDKRHTIRRSHKRRGGLEQKHRSVSEEKEWACKIARVAATNRLLTIHSRKQVSENRLATQTGARFRSLWET